MSTFYFIIYNITNCPTTLAGGLGVGFGGLGVWGFCEVDRSTAICFGLIFLLLLACHVFLSSLTHP